MEKQLEPVIYSERLTPSISVVFALVLLSLGAGLIALPFAQDLTLLIGSGTFLVMLVLSFALAPRIHLTKSTLTVGRATIERSFLSKASSIESDHAFRERGANLDSRAFTMFRPGIKTLVKVQINDDKDPTPYWLFSTRNPEVLCQFLNQAN